LGFAFLIWQYLDGNEIGKKRWTACKILCQGDVIAEVTKRQLFNRSKDFTDMALKIPAYQILDAYKKLPSNRTDETVINFLNKYFEPHASDFDDCTFSNLPNLPPSDFYEGIIDPLLRSFAKSVHKTWPVFCGRIKDEVYEAPNRHTLLPLKHATMVMPDDVSRELYYWDSYFILKGLLTSGLQNEAIHLVENFVDLIHRYVIFRQVHESII